MRKVIKVMSKKKSTLCFLLILSITLSAFSLTLEEAFALALEGPEGKLLKASSATSDFYYSLEVNSRYTTHQNLSIGELKAATRYQGLNVTSTYNILTERLDTRFSWPISFFSPVAPKRAPADVAISLRGKIVNLFFALLENDSSLPIRELSLEIAQTEYENVKREFERGNKSVNDLTLALSSKQKARDQLEQVKSNYVENLSDIYFYLSLPEIPKLTYDYSQPFAIIDTLPLTEEDSQNLDFPLLYAKYELQQIKSQQYPQFTLEGVVTVDNLSVASSYLGVNLRYLLVDSNRKSRLQTAYDKIETETIQREIKERELLKQKKRWLSDYNNAVVALDTAKVVLDETTELYNLVERAFADGLVHEFELKKTKLALQQAQHQLKVAHHKCTKMQLVINGLIPYQQQLTPGIY